MEGALELLDWWGNRKCRQPVIQPGVFFQLWAAADRLACFLRVAFPRAGQPDDPSA